jgi:hypothetical protein
MIINRNIERNKLRRHVRVNGLKVFEHIAVWEGVHGKKPKDLMIHHIDGDKSNNELSNLLCVDRKEHGRLHREMNKK